MKELIKDVTQSETGKILSRILKERERNRKLSVGVSNDGREHSRDKRKPTAQKCKDTSPTERNQRIQSYLDRKIPPQVIWTLLTREKRRKFIAEGQITVDQSELNYARRARGGQKGAQKDIDEIDNYLRGNKGVLKQTISKQGEPPQDRFILFGSEYRQHICTAEIFNECFGQDKRKSMHRISEILSMLDGWTLGKRLQKADPEYKDQPKPYYRDEDNLPEDDGENDETEHEQDFSGDPISLDDLPLDI